MEILRCYIREQMTYRPDINREIEVRKLELKHTILTITYVVFPEEIEEVAMFDILGDIAKKICGKRAHYFYDAVQNWLDAQL